MRHASSCSYFDSQCPFRCEGDAILGGFAVHEKFASGGSMIVGDLRAQAVAFLAYNKEQTDMRPLAAKTLRRRHLRGDDSFCVARTAPIDTVGVFGGGNERWHGIHVSGKNDCRRRTLGRGCEDVETITFDGDLLRLIADTAEFAVKIISNCCFIARD